MKRAFRTDQLEKPDKSEQKAIHQSLSTNSHTKHYGLIAKRLSQLDPSSKTAAKLKGSLTFYIDTYKSNLKVVLKDNTIYPNSLEELQAILNTDDEVSNPSTEVAPNQITPTSKEVSMDTSEEPQNEPIPTEESCKIPPKRLTFRDQTQDPKVQGPEIRNQYSPLSKMDTENSKAMPERKKQIPPFFITPMNHGQKPAKS
ncbi:hypothetical protein CEXT_196661 [Caerostris extrusa]|uniref:Uncharacterized protein n=1 Tax=Caerostris extrusa TaxID=172846 RepID=A0AAV4S3J7_CAEEX|nr:hypothetical protein CEXT_196661 [Caerostris extrusa]